MRVVRRRFGWIAWLVAACVLATCVVAPAARAQRPQLTAREVGQIVDEALRIVVAPDTVLSGVPVAKRGLAFDARRTLAEFGASGAADTTVPLTRSVRLVTDTIMRDCSQLGIGTCASLGSRVFVTISPLSFTSSHAHVRVTVAWATPMVHVNADGTTTEHTFLSWFSTTIHLARASDDRWNFVRQDPTVVVG